MDNTNLKWMMTWGTPISGNNLKSMLHFYGKLKALQNCCITLAKSKWPLQAELEPVFTLANS